MTAEIKPTPSDEEAAAIVAAVEMLWPRAGAGADEGPRRPSNRWRFSGRWWAGPLPRTRQRP